MDISVILPAYNEEENVEKIYSSLKPVVKKIGKHEIIFVDDGSTDKTYSELLNLKKKDKNVKIIKFRKNFGQTAAWDAGFKHAKGKYVVTMDADLQNNPKDIPKLLEKLKQGYDVVSGWRYDRKDPILKRLFSGISLFLRKLIIDDKIHDSGCALKIYKKSALKNLDLHGEMHRYITELLALRGYKIGEVKVSHNKRKYGRTKYNIIRLPKGFLDLLIVAFWQKYSARPIHLFGGAGIFSSIIGGITGLYLVFRKFYYNEAIADRPLLLLAALLVILGIQFIIFGLIADILVKIYYKGERTTYSIESIK